MQREFHPRPRAWMPMITSAEILRLLEAAPTREHYLVAALVCAGARPGELTSLCRDDVDLHGRVVRVRGKVGERFLPIPLVLADVLEKYLASQDERDKHAGRAPATGASPLFRGRSGGARTLGALQSVFRIHAMRTLGRPLLLHALRRWSFGPSS